MRVRIERLRVWLLVSAGLLVVVIAGFLEFAHLRSHRFLKNLPARLGAEVTRESSGYTYSQTSGGRTVFTIHASRVVQRKDGKTMLHDVGIVLYGQKGDRADRIYGNEFEYDQKDGVIRAVGLVHMDLQAPAPTDARGRATDAAGGEVSGAQPALGDTSHLTDGRMVHVTTSGLVYVQSLGAASTDQEIEFEYHGMNGRALGADYNSDTGVTVLQSAIEVSGLQDGTPLRLTATHAELDRLEQQLHLTHARYFSGASGGRVATAEQATLHRRGDGSVDHAVGRGGVSLEQGGGVLRGASADAVVNDRNHPETVVIDGGMQYASAEALREVQARAGRGTVRFDGAGKAETGLLEGAAEIHVRERMSASLPWNERTVTGARVEGRFAEAGDRQWLPETAVSGGARVLLSENAEIAGRTGTTVSDMRGDVLTAKMVWTGRAARLSEVNGTGHTSLERRDAAGGVATSRGETLDVSFAAADRVGSRTAVAEGVGRGGPGQGVVGATIARAVQTGGVELTSLPAARPGEKAAPVLTRARGNEAVYVAAGETLTVRGGAEVAQADDLLRADAVVLQRNSGDVTATGHVTASLRQGAAAVPVHVAGARGEFAHATGLGRVYGDVGGVPAGEVARLWQGASQVEAPVIEFDRVRRTVRANSEGRVGVRTVLSRSDSGGATPRGAGTLAGGMERPQVMRIASRTLDYLDAERKAMFEGGVVLEDANGTVQAPEVMALLAPAATPSAAEGGRGGTTEASPLLGGRVEQVIATGGVRVSEAGRQATGERLVYTAADGRFVMTGTPSAPPRVEDGAQGVITGAALEFYAGDNSVMVVGDGKGGKGRRVRTETMVQRP